MHVHVRLTDADEGPWISASALAADGSLMAFDQGDTACEALELLELRLIYLFEKPITFHIEDECHPPPCVRVVLEDIAYCGVFVATAFDDEGTEIGRGESVCGDCAVAECLHAAQVSLGCNRLDVDVDVLDPNDD